MNNLKSLLINNKLVTYTVNASKRINFKGFKGYSLYHVISFYVQQINKVGIYDRASVISFNLIMALPAAMLFLFSIIPYLPESQTYKFQILGLLKDLSPTSGTYKLIESVLNDLLKKHVGIFSFGFLLLIYYSSSATVGMIRSFDHSIKERKHFFLSQRWRAIQLTFILMLVVIVGAALLYTQQESKKMLIKLFHLKKSSMAWFNMFRWIIIAAMFYYAISLIYKFAPSVKKRWSLYSPGSVTATVLMLLTTWGFSYWVNNFGNYNKVYGSIGTVLILMLLIYFNSIILLIGFELNVSINNLENRKVAHD